jgi:hypothetical protein
MVLRIHGMDEVGVRSSVGPLMKIPIYKIREKVYLYNASKASWHFVNVSKNKSKEIKKLFGGMAGGWGALPVIVTVGKTRWKTSVFPDSKKGVYILPLKAEVRKKENFCHGNILKYSIEINI